MDCRFYHVEFTLVTRLRFSRKANISNYVTTIGLAWSRGRYFLGAKHVSYADLGRTIMS